MVDETNFTTMAYRANYFLATYDGFSNDHTPLVMKSLEQIKRNPELRINELSLKNQCYTKWIQVQFQRHLGAKPHEFIKLSRFNQFLSLLGSNSDNSLTNLALEAGYHDQSHLIMEFKDINAASPP